MNVLILLTYIYLSVGISPENTCFHIIAAICYQSITLLYYTMQCIGSERSYHSLTKIISLPFGVIEYIYQTNCVFITMVSANVSVLVVGSIPTSIALRAKLPLARAN